jgi:hypothetical protein
MSDQIKFKAFASLGDCTREIILEIDKEDLEDIPEEEWVDYVCQYLDGEADALALVETWVERIMPGER